MRATETTVKRPAPSIGNLTARSNSLRGPGSGASSRPMRLLVALLAAAMTLRSARPSLTPPRPRSRSNPSPPSPIGPPPSKANSRPTPKRPKPPSSSSTPFRAPATAAPAKKTGNRPASSARRPRQPTDQQPQRRHEIQSAPRSRHLRRPQRIPEQILLDRRIQNQRRACARVTSTRSRGSLAPPPPSRGP